MKLQGWSPALSKGPLLPGPISTGLFLLYKNQPQAHQLGVLSREEQAHSLLWCPCGPAHGELSGWGVTNQSLAAPQPLALSPDIISPDIWLSGLIELMLGGSWQARKPHDTHIRAHPALTDIAFLLVAEN